MHCSQGEICGVLGANGAGKSTLFKIITGLMTPSSGEICIHSNGKKSIGAIIEKPALYPYLNAFENLKVFAQIQDLKLSKTAIHDKLEEVGLESKNDLEVSKYSMGMKQRLGIAIALLNNPSTLVWDEPFNGLDPMGTENLKNLIASLAKEKNIAVIISSHITEPLLSICDTMVVLKKGQMLLSGTLSEVIDRHITHYEIKGIGLVNAKAMQPFNYVVKGDSLIVKIAPDDIPKLLGDLITEGVKVQLCRPHIIFDTLL